MKHVSILAVAFAAVAVSTPTSADAQRTFFGSDGGVSDVAEMQRLMTGGGLPELVAAVDRRARHRYHHQVCRAAL